MVGNKAVASRGDSMSPELQIVLGVVSALGLIFLLGLL